MTSDADRGPHRRPPTPAPPGRGPGRGPGRWVAGAALLVGAPVLCGCSSGTPSGGQTVVVTPTVVVTDTPTPSASSTTTVRLVPPQTYEEALQHLATGTADPANPTAFTSPTGNIVCTILAGGKVRGCELEAGRIAAPSPTFCAKGGAPDIGRVQLSASGPVAVCNTDSIAKAGTPVLKYGSRAQSGSVGCVSESIGMTCVDASSGKGFFLARDTFFIF